MTKKQLKIKLNNIIDRKQKTYGKFAENKHRTRDVIEIMSRTDAELIAFNSVLDALNNNDVMINTY